MHAQRNVSNSSGAIPNINTTRILEKEANWRPKNDHTHSLIPLCTYLYVFMPHGMQGRKNQEIKGTSPDPLPPTGRRRGRVWLRETNLKMYGVGFRRRKHPGYVILCVSNPDVTMVACSHGT